LKRGAYASPCETIPFGEVEDYTIHLVNGGPVACSITAAVASIQCSDNGTSANPSDDTFTFALTVNGTGTGASWSASIGGTAYTGTYGLAKTIGPLPISGGVVNFTIKDAADANCTAAKSVTPPAACSTTNLCTISTLASSPVCNDNGTPANPADDTYTFNLTVTGNNTGTGWAASILGTPQAGAYGIATLMGPFPISAGNLNFTVKDGSDANCAKAVSITPPTACSNGGGGTSYCDATSDFPWHDWITGVSLANVNNVSGKQAHSNFTGLTANVMAGGSYPLALSAGFSWYTYEEHWKVWIDYNHDGIFQEPAEVAFSFTQTAPPNGTLEATVNGTINIPAGATLGTTRMRVAMKRGADPLPCETLPFGEVEEYSVNIAAVVGGSTGERALSMQLNAQAGHESIDLWGAVETPAGAVAWHLEKSADGFSYQAFQSGNLEAGSQYAIVDEKDTAPAEGSNFYRLSLVGPSGNVLSTITAAAIFNSVAEFNIFPNPAQGEFYVEMSKLAGRHVALMVYDQMGRPVYREVIEKSAATLHRIQAQGWEEGLYFVELLPENRQPVTKRLVVVR
jgi:hypothetical protein